MADIPESTSTTPAGQEVERLREALAHNRQGWANAIEFGLIPHRYCDAARKLIEEADAALATSSVATPADDAGVRDFRNRVVRLLEDMYNECTHSDTEAFAYQRAAKEVRALMLSTSPKAPSVAIGAGEVDARWTIEGVQAEMLAVATAGLDDDSELADEWPIDCRADIDRWQAVIRNALAARIDWRELRDLACGKVHNGSGFHTIHERAWRELAAALTPPSASIPADVEREAIARAILDGWYEGNESWERPHNNMLHTRAYWAADAVIALAARPSTVGDAS